MSLGRYLKPSADFGGTNSNLELLPDPNAESGEPARAVVVAADNKEVVAVLSGTTTIYLFHVYKSWNHYSVNFITVLY